MARLPEQLRWAAALLAGLGFLGSLGLLLLYRSLPSTTGRARKIRVGLSVGVAVLVILCLSGAIGAAWISRRS